MLDFTDSIAAIATPPGRGGIAIVRISGSDARKIALLLTTPHAAHAAVENTAAESPEAATTATSATTATNTSTDTSAAAAGDTIADATAAVAGNAAIGAAAVLAKADAAALKPRYAYFRKFYNSLEAVDEGVLLYFAAPHSYTGEDVIELQGHGGNVAPQRLLSAVLALNKVAGIRVRMAEPGEFTRRAFLNGKMDLTAAEAVEDLISAGSDSAAKAALASLNGAFADRLEQLSAALTQFRVRLEACLDFPEEHEDFFDSGKAQKELAHLQDLTTQAVTIAQQGLKLNEGARIVLAGQPNAGKSSLLNALAGSDRAIVTNIPGTTRDVLTVNLEIGGIPVTITDTAGLRDQPSDEIEAIGIKRALDELKKADLILLMIDSSRPSYDALEALGYIQKLFDNPKNLLIIKSKEDLQADPQTTELLHSAPLTQYEQISTSTKTENGLVALRQKLNELLGVIPSEGVFSARRRHLNELQECTQALDRAAEMLEMSDLVLTAREVALAQEHLGTITGKITSDDILGIIFSTFCIGK